MKTSFRFLILALAGMAAGGCTVGMTPEVFARHRLDGEFARLEKLYESGAIDAEQLTNRRQALVELQERLNKKDREDAIRRASEPDPFPANDAPNCKSRDERHPRR